MRKELKYLLFLFILFVSCEEYYQPAIDEVNGQLVVEAKITNDIARNFVHLSRTRSFYDQQPILNVSGASVQLIDLDSKAAIKGNESSSGVYVFSSAPESGKTYFLRIVISNDTYESAAVTMPPIPSMSNFYTEHVVRKVFKNNTEGIPQSFDRPGREFYVDLPVTPALSYYRFDVKTVYEWHWDINPNTRSQIPTAYGWYVYHEKLKFNLAAPKSFVQNGKIEKHSLLNVSYNIYDYIYADTLYSKFDTLYTKGCILVVDQYGTSKSSYDFHEKLNSQFEATGNLFDPVQTQIFGNVLCKSDPLKIVYGFFDVTSVRQYRYYFNLWEPPGKVYVRQIDRYPDIPDQNGMLISQPIAGPPEEVPPPLPPPVWWEKYQ